MWKQDTPDQMLRDSFARPSLTMTAVAKQRAKPASSRHVTNTKFCVCYNLRAMLHDNVSSRFRQELAFVVLQVSLDESQFDVLTGPRRRSRGRSNLTSVLGAHGRLALADHELREEEDEIPLMPTAIESNSAACFWSSFRTELPKELFDFLSGELPSNIDLGAIAIGSDQHRANVMLGAHIENSAPANVLFFEGFCKQHSTGSCLERLVKLLGILNPGYCIAKKSKSGSFLKDLKKGFKDYLVEGHLRVVKPGEEYAADAGDLRYIDSVLELAYFRRDLRTSSADATDGGDCGEEVRRLRGAELKRRCPGNWRTGDVVYIDIEGATESIADAADKVWELLESCGLASFPEPALNKWLSVWPLFCTLLIMMSFHGMLPVAWRRACKVEGDVGNMSDVSADERVGILSKEAWLKRDTRRSNKALAWLERRTSYFLCMLFVFLASKCMLLHFWLFKHAQNSPWGDEKSVLFNLCDPQKSNVQAVINDLWSLLRPAASWGCLPTTFGEFQTWPPRWKSLARDGVHVLICELKMRLTDELRKPPYNTLVPIADPGATSETVDKALDVLFDSSGDEALDSNSKKVKNAVGSRQALKDSRKWRAFLFKALNMVPVANSFIECLFGSYKQWLGASPKPIAMPLLQAKSFSWQWQSACDRKRDRDRDTIPQGRVPAKRQRQRRPEWVLKGGDNACRNGRHEFMGTMIRERGLGVSTLQAFRQASSKWREAAPKAKAKAKAAARIKNVVTKTLKLDRLSHVAIRRDDVPSPWSVTRGSEEYVHPADIEAILARTGALITDARKWEDLGRCELARDPTFPSSVVYSAPPDIDALRLSEAERATASALLSNMQTILAPHGVSSMYTGRHFMISGENGPKHIVRCYAVRKSPVFGASFVEYQKADEQPWPHGDIVLPCAASVAHGQTMTANELCIQLAMSSDGPFSFQPVLEDVALISHPGSLHIASVCPPIDFSRERSMNLERLAAARAFKLFKQSQLPWHQQRSKIAARRKLQRGPGACTADGAEPAHEPGADGAVGGASLPSAIKDGGDPVLYIDDIIKPKLTLTDDPDEVDALSSSDDEGYGEKSDCKLATKFKPVADKEVNKWLKGLACHWLGKAAGDMAPVLAEPLAAPRPLGASSTDAWGPMPEPTEEPKAFADDGMPLSTLAAPRRPGAPAASSTDARGPMPEPTEEPEAPADDGMPLAALADPTPPGPAKACTGAFRGKGEFYDIGPGLGVIVIERVRGVLVAHCPLSRGKHSTPTMPECRKTCKAAKCPLGMLIAWLKISRSFDSHATHLKGHSRLTLESRKLARASKENDPTLKPLFDYEREMAGGLDRVTEPCECP